MIPGSPTTGQPSKGLSPDATPTRTINSSPSAKSWTEAPVLTKEKGSRLFPLRKSQVKVRSYSPDPDAESSYISTGGYSAAGIRVPESTKSKANRKQRKRRQQQQQQEPISPIATTPIAAEESSETTSHGGYSAAGIRLPPTSGKRSGRLLRYKAAHGHGRSNLEKADEELHHDDTTNKGISPYSSNLPSLPRIKCMSNTTRNLDDFFAQTNQPTATPGDNGTHASGDRAAGGSTVLSVANRGDDRQYNCHQQKQAQYSMFSQSMHPHPNFATVVRPSIATNNSVKSSTAYSCTTRTISEDLRSNTSDEPSTSSTIRSAQAIEAMLLFQKPDFLNSQADVSSNRWNMMPYNRGSLKFGPPLKSRASIQGSSSSSVISDLPYIPPRREGLIPTNTRRHIQQTLMHSRSGRSFSESEDFVGSPPYDSKSTSLKGNFLLPHTSDSPTRTLSRENTDWPSTSSVTVTSSVISDLPEVPPRKVGLLPEAVANANWRSLNHTQQQHHHQQQQQQQQQQQFDDSINRVGIPSLQQPFMQARTVPEIFDGTSRESSGVTNVSSLQRSVVSSSVASSFVSALPTVPPRPIGLIPNKNTDLNPINGYQAVKEDDIGNINGANDESNLGRNERDRQINTNYGNELQSCSFNPLTSASASPVVTATDVSLIPSSSGNATTTTTISAICISGTSSESFNGQSTLPNDAPLIIDHEKRRTFLQSLPALKKMQHQVSGLTMSGTESGSSSKIEAEKELHQGQIDVSKDTNVPLGLTDELEACRQYLNSEKATKETIPSPFETSDQKRDRIRLGRNLVLARDSTMAVSDLTISSSLLHGSNASLQNSSWYGPSLVRVEEMIDDNSDDDAEDKEAREIMKCSDDCQNSESKDAHSRLNCHYIPGAIDTNTIGRYDEEGDLAAGTVARNLMEGHVTDGGEKQMDAQPSSQFLVNFIRSTSQCGDQITDQITEWPHIPQNETKVVEQDFYSVVFVDEAASGPKQGTGSIEGNGDEGELCTNSLSPQQQKLDSYCVPMNTSNDFIMARTEQNFLSPRCDIEENVNFDVDGIEGKQEQGDPNLLKKPDLSPLKDECSSELEVDFPKKTRDVEAIGDLDVSFPPPEQNRRFRQSFLGNEIDRVVKVDEAKGSKTTETERDDESLAEAEDRSVGSNFSKRSKRSQYHRLPDKDGEADNFACFHPNDHVNNDRLDVQSVNSFSILKGKRSNSSSHSVSSVGSRRSLNSHLDIKDNHSVNSLMREEQEKYKFNVLSEEEISIMSGSSFADFKQKKMDSACQASIGSRRSNYSRLSGGEEREEKSLSAREQVQEKVSVGFVNGEGNSVNSQASVSSSRSNHLKSSSSHSVSSKDSRRSRHSRLEGDDDYKSLTSSEERNIFRKSIEKRRREDIFTSGFVDEGIITASDEEKERHEAVKERSSRNAFMRDFRNVYDVESNEDVESFDEISVLESLHEGLESEDELSQKAAEGKEPGALYETWKRCTKPCGKMTWWKWSAVVAVCFLIVGGIVAAVVVPRSSSTAPSASSAPTTSGTSPPFTNSTGIVTSTFEVTPWDEGYVDLSSIGLPGDGAGVSVSLSGHGNRLAVGSPYLNTSYGTSAGLVSLYDVRQQNGKMFWTLVGRLYGNISGQEFGVSVSLNEGGDILSVGSVNNNAALSSNAGSISVYRIQERTSEAPSRGLNRQRQPSNLHKATVADGPYEMFLNYSLQYVGQTIKQKALSDGKYYGLSLSLSNTGDKLAVGVPNAGNNSGTVFAYAYNSDTDTWNPILLRNATGDKDDNLGWSVAISGDGTVLAAGAPQHQSSAHGYVNVYHLTSTSGKLSNTISSSGSWTSSMSSVFSLDRFGHSVSLDDSGGILAIGAPKSNVTNVALSAGIAAVFVQDPSTSQWSVMGGKVLEGEAGDELGFSVSLSSSGTRIAVGAPQTNNSGAVLIYDFTNNVWQMAPPIEGNGTGSDFGFSVSLNSKGTEVALGVPFLTACQLLFNVQRRIESVCNAGTSMVYEDSRHRDVNS